MLSHVRRGTPSRLVAFVSLLGVIACDPGSANDLAASASSEAERLKNDVKSAATDKLDGVTSAATDKLDGATSAAKSELDKGIVQLEAKVFGLPSTGQLSEGAVAWLTEQKPASTGTALESTVAKGVQIAPVALEAYRLMNEVVDEETAIEPIYQEVAPGKEPELDAQIKAMPRVEVIDGVTVGFRKLDSVETTKLTKEEAVLVLWRRDQHLVGFLYRKRREIDVATVIKETPRLVGLLNEAAKAK